MARDRCRASGSSARAFRSSRGILPGVNSGTVDLHYLRATPLIDLHIDRDGIDRAFDEAVAKNGWLIFYSHDVRAAPSPYGCSPALLRHALDAAVAPQRPDPERRRGLAAGRRLKGVSSGQFKRLVLDHHQRGLPEIRQPLVFHNRLGFVGLHA